ncbi:MAG: response regulator [Deltaproteobacteria bacterium]|nr:response regulator [Deltaproteobacteria bacterium]
MSGAPLVVCVDDDPAVARALARAMRGEHLLPMATTEPAEALEWVLAHDVAVLVSDYNMPEMNGVQLAARVRELRPSTVRILVTGSLDLDTAMASINQGEVFRFVPKPFDVAHVARVIRDGVEQHRALAQVAAEREKVERRQRERATLEARWQSLTTPARAHDGAYLIPHIASDRFDGLGLDDVLALRR